MLTWADMIRLPLERSARSTELAMASVAFWMSSTIPFLTPCDGVIPTPRMRRSSSGVTSATSVQTLLLPTSIPASMLSLKGASPPVSLEGRTVSEAEVQDVPGHRLASQTSLNRLPNGHFVVHVLTVAYNHSIPCVRRQRQTLLRRVIERGHVRGQRLGHPLQKRLCEHDSVVINVIPRGQPRRAADVANHRGAFERSTFCQDNPFAVDDITVLADLPDGPWASLRDCDPDRVWPAPFQRC